MVQCFTKKGDAWLSVRSPMTTSGYVETLRREFSPVTSPAADALGRIKKRYAEWILYINNKPAADALGIDGSIDYHSGNRYTLRNTQCNDNRPAADALGRIKKRYAEWILYINDKPAADALGIDG